MATVLPFRCRLNATTIQRGRPVRVSVFRSGRRVGGVLDGQILVVHLCYLDLHDGAATGLHLW